MAESRKFPSDLLLVIGLVVLTNIFALVPPFSESFMRTAAVLPMILFLPGYALAAAFFPARDELDGIERAALSVGLSIAVVPLIGLGLNYTSWGIRLIPILVSLSAFTLAMCAAAYYRRRQLPEDRRFEVPFKASALALKAEVLEKPETKVDKILTAILILSIFVSLGILVYTIVTPKEDEQFTEFYILGPGGMAENYPIRYQPGDSKTVIVGIVNHEYRTVNYTLDVRLENKSLTLPENLKNIRLGHNMTWEEPVTITPPSEGTDMKLEFLLYNDTGKSVPYRDLYLWINVSKTAKEA